MLKVSFLVRGDRGTAARSSGIGKGIICAVDLSICPSIHLLQVGENKEKMNT